MREPRQGVDLPAGFSCVRQAVVCPSVAASVVLDAGERGELDVPGILLGVAEIPLGGEEDDGPALAVLGAHEGRDPERFDVNPNPPVEFGAPGRDVRVTWLEGWHLIATGNSFAAPHITGLVVRILGEHPKATVFDVKTMLYALARKARRLHHTATP